MKTLPIMVLARSLSVESSAPLPSISLRSVGEKESYFSLLFFILQHCLRVLSVSELRRRIYASAHG